MGAGPDALLERGLATRLQADGHDVDVVEIEPSSTSWHAEVGTAFELARAIATRVSRSRAQRRLPFILSGNCAPAAWGAVAGLGADTGVCWFDAHGDFNTPETTITGFLDGMALAAVTGRCWTTMMGDLPGFRPVADRSVLLIGARAFDPKEGRALRESEITRLPPPNVLSGLSSAGVAQLLSNHITSVYLHVDLDVLDPTEAVANASRQPGGLHGADVDAALRSIAAALPVQAAALTAYDPVWDSSGRAAEIAIDLACTIARGVHRSREL
jgi:arginase